MKISLKFYLLIIAVAVSLPSCSLLNKSTTVRGYVHSGDQKVTGGEVRLTSSKGGAEAITQIGIDGRFRITLEHPSGAKLELKVLQPGFVHDPIEFNAGSAPQGEMDINLRRVFQPNSQNNSNRASNSPSNK
jgi:hypothetical protein